MNTLYDEDVMNQQEEISLHVYSKKRNIIVETYVAKNNSAKYAIEEIIRIKYNPKTYAVTTNKGLLRNAKNYKLSIFE